MTKKTLTIFELISRIERAPNVALLVDAYEAAIEDSIVSVHRVRGTEWQVWHGEWIGCTGTFTEVRAYLARDAEETLRPGDAHFVSASADDAHIILCGIEAERAGGDRLAAEIAAAAAISRADLEQERADLLDMIEGTEHLQSLIQASVDRAAAGLGSTTATQDSVEALRLHAVELRRQLAAMPVPVPMVQQVAQQQQANAGARLTVVTNPTPPTHCSCCGRRLTDHVSVRHGIGPICRANGAAPTRDLFTTRSDYTVEDLLDVILVVDLDRGGRSVSNDAAGVIDDLRKAGLIRPGVPVVYRDSSGTWDQLRIKDGKFVGFSSVGVLTREDAIAWARAN